MRFEQRPIDHASKRLHEIARKRFSLEKELVIYAFVGIKAVQAQERVRDIEKIGIPHVQKKVGNIGLHARHAAIPSEIPEVGCEESF